MTVPTLVVMHFDPTFAAGSSPPLTFGTFLVSFVLSRSMERLMSTSFVDLLEVLEILTRMFFFSDALDTVEAAGIAAMTDDRPMPDCPDICNNVSSTPCLCITYSKYWETSQKRSKQNTAHDTCPPGSAYESVFLMAASNVVRSVREPSSNVMSMLINRGLHQCFRSRETFRRSRHY